MQIVKGSPLLSFKSEKHDEILIGFFPSGSGSGQKGPNSTGSVSTALVKTKSKLIFYNNSNIVISTSYIYKYVLRAKLIVITVS